MAQRILVPVKILEATRPTAGNGPRPPGRDGGNGGGGGQSAAVPGATVRVGLWFFLTAVTMLFIAFTVAYAARRTAADWTLIVLPPVLWVNTLLLLTSSGTLEWARRRWRRGDGPGLRRLLSITTLLGAAFLAGQITAWRELAAAGAFMATSPHSAYFHLLTAVHGLHLLGGVGALGYALRRATVAVPAGRTEVLPTESAGLAATTDNVAIYWHFLTALWVYIFVMLLT